MRVKIAVGVFEQLTDFQQRWKPEWNMVAFLQNLLVITLV